MVFNFVSDYPDIRDSRPPPRTSTPIRRQKYSEAKKRNVQPGDLIALVGQHMEKLQSIDREVLVFNSSIGRVLVKYPLNNASFDMYIGLPFTKGLTERVTGRTQLIIGSAEHHISAAANQFEDILWDEGSTPDFGDCIRWVNIGDAKYGFVGLDYTPGADKSKGIANSEEDVSFLAKTLMAYGYDPEKRLFLIKPPSLQESEHGAEFRRRGLRRLRDFK